ncbi:cytochrome P450 6k1-like isoform X2 [Chrysoperla carnea]|uniref:cytochrome P450 6k1-like isoform X2 n=1 Tax=Chrysoperla carnea TaxID=189513 RepID=UPI001D0679BE|nr:cytochrome P450 6k1-like isoform X2 [Chrysoperla carnea]
MALVTSSWFTDILTLLIVTLSIVYYFLTSTYNYWKNKNIPYEKPTLIFGNFYNAVTFQQNITDFFADQYRKTKEKFFGLYIFRRPYLLIRDPELAKYVLIKDFNNFIPRTSAPTYKDDPLGEYNLFSMKSTHDWRFIRSKLSPIFSSGKLRNMFPLVNENGENLNGYLKNHVFETLEGKSVCQNYTTDAIVSTVMGLSVNSFKDEETEFDRISKGLFTVTLRRATELMFFFFVPFLSRLLRLKVFSEMGSQFYRNLFWSAVKMRQDNNIKRPDLIDALITLKNYGTIEDADNKEQKKEVVSNPSQLKLDGDVLVAQIALFYAAGLNTSSAAMSFTCYSLSYNPEIQIKLRKEIQTVLARNGGKLTYESVFEMKYLDCCFKETLRLYPSLGYLDREALDTYTFPGTNLTIEKGTPVIISLAGMQKDPQYFKNPDVYDPERFNDENKDKIPPYVFMPFGDGPRNCIGARLGHESILYRS